MSTLYETRKATVSNNYITLDICTSAFRLAIDPRVWLEWELAFESGVDDSVYDLQDYYIFESEPDGNGNHLRLPFKDGTHFIAFRPGWCITRGIEHISTVVNNKNRINHCPREYLDALTRVYTTEKECHTNTSGGTFDTGSFDLITSSNLLSGTYSRGDYEAPDPEDMYLVSFDNPVLPPIDIDNRETLVTLHVPGHKSTEVNNGLETRIIETRRKIMHGNEDTNAVNVWGEFSSDPSKRYFPQFSDTFTVCEPLCIEPFFAFQKFMPGKPLDFIHRLKVNIKMQGDLFSYACNAKLKDSDEPIKLVVKNVTAHVRYIPRQVESIPNELCVHNCYKKSFTMSRSDALKYVATGENTFKFQLMAQHPVMYFYIQRQDQSYSYPTEHFLGIKQLKIETPKIRQTLTARQLYDIWRKESLDHTLSFREWAETKSVCVLYKDEIQFENELKLTVSWTNYWNRYQYTDEEITSIEGAELDVIYDACLIVGNYVELNT